MRTKLLYFLQLFFIAILGVIIASNLGSSAGADDTPEIHIPIEEPPHPSVYLAPPTSFTELNPIVSTETLLKAGIARVGTPDDLSNYVISNPEIGIIYLHPDVVEEVSTEWLQEQYRSGIAIVAIDTPIGVLARKLNERTNFQDLRPIEGWLIVSLMYKNSSESPTEDHWFYSNHHRTFVELPAVLDATIRANFEEPSRESH